MKFRNSTVQYNERNCRLEKDLEKYKKKYEKPFDFETITSEYEHMPHLCWIYNGDIQHECVGINTCAVDMLDALPIGKGELLLIAHSSDYDCRFILECLQNVKPIVISNRFLQVKATYYNPKGKTEINIIVEGSYKLIPMPLRDFGKCFKLDVSKETMLYNVYTYEIIWVLVQFRQL